MEKSLKKRIIHFSRNSVFTINRILDNFHDVIWLIGDGRSGTTWISDMINHDGRYRTMFEPFHPQFNKKLGFQMTHHYIRPEETNIDIVDIASDIFSGKYTNPRVDQGNRSLKYKGLLIKDVFANLFSYWASLNFNIKEIILLVRNPFAVALSKYKKRDWFWVTDPLTLLNQKKLYNDYLYKFEDLIIKTSEKKDYIMNQILIWSIINYIPLIQFGSDKIKIIFYENFYIDPYKEMNELQKNDSDFSSTQLNKNIINNPSRYSGKESNIVQCQSPIYSWKNEIKLKQINDGLKILEGFGLHDLYGESSIPDIKALSKLNVK